MSPKCQLNAAEAALQSDKCEMARTYNCRVPKVMLVGSRFAWISLQNATWEAISGHVLSCFIMFSALSRMERGKLSSRFQPIHYASATYHLKLPTTEQNRKYSNSQELVSIPFRTRNGHGNASATAIKA